MNVTRILWLPALLMMLCVASLSCYSEDTSEYWPVLSVDQKEFDFGTVDQGQIVRHNFVITNKGKGHLRIIDVKSSSAAMEAYPLKEHLAAGESTEIRTVFDTDIRWGKQKKRITIDTNDPDRLSYRIYLKGTIRADYELEPSLLYTKRKKKSKDHFGSIALKNVSGKPMKVLKLESEDHRVTPAFTPPFKSPVVLADGQSVSIDAKFRPDLPRQAGRDVVKVYVAGRKRPIVIPVRIKRKK